MSSGFENNKGVDQTAPIAPLLFAYKKVSYLNLLQAKFLQLENEIC